MTDLQLKPMILGIVTIAAAAVVLFIQQVLIGSHDASLLLNLTFWIALIQGSVAMAAAADISQGKWITPIKKDLLAFYHLMLPVAVLFLALGFQMKIFPWTEKHHLWLNTPFFLGRNFGMLLLSWLVAHLYARAAVQERESKNTWALIYIFLFVITQSLVAFDWIMSLEYPWFSTLFGGIFFMESFYTGITVAALTAVYFLVTRPDKKAVFSKVLRDSAIFMFGFALAWAGLFYAQFLVIWYGNLPEEASYLVIRMHQQPYETYFYLSIIFLFIIPFVGLVPKKLKTSPVYVSFISFIVLAGILIEKVLFILPDVPISIWGAALQFVLFGGLMVLFFTSRKTVLKLRDE